MRYWHVITNSNHNLLISDLRTAFDLLDRDQDGMVTPTELQFMLRNLGIDVSDDLIDALMKEASKTGKSAILKKRASCFICNWKSYEKIVILDTRFQFLFPSSSICGMKFNISLCHKCMRSFKDDISAIDILNIK